MSPIRRRIDCGCWYLDGGDEQRQIVAGVRSHYTQDELLGKTIVVVWNLQPATIRGVESKGCCNSSGRRSGSSSGAGWKSVTRLSSRIGGLLAVLVHLSVEDLGLIERIEFDPGQGLHVLTGETGVGKSMLLASMQMLRGERTRNDMIRRGADRAVVRGIFSLNESSPKKVGELLGISIEDGEIDHRTGDIPGRSQPLPDRWS